MGCRGFCARRNFHVCILTLGLLGFVLIPLTSRAQVSASITGNVVDATGAVVRDAAITVKSLETGATRTVTTDDLGDYRVLSLPLGPQELTAEKKGFKSVVRSGVSLEVGQEAVVNFRLDLGELVQQMAVTEKAPVVNTTTASISGMVDERQIKELPLNGRSFDDLITSIRERLITPRKAPIPARATETRFPWPAAAPLKICFC